MQLGPSTLSTWPNTKEAQTATSSSVAKSPALYHAQGTFHRALHGRKSKGYQSNIWIRWSNQPAGQPHACEQLPEMSIHCMKLDYNRLHTDVCQFHGSWSNTPWRLEELHIVQIKRLPRYLSRAKDACLGQHLKTGFQKCKHRWVNNFCITSTGSTLSTLAFQLQLILSFASVGSCGINSGVCFVHVQI